MCRYCDCFANGEFCNGCNCCSCANNLDHEVDRLRAIRACLERNPYAFHPKIGEQIMTAADRACFILYFIHFEGVADTNYLLKYLHSDGSSRGQIVLFRL